MLCIRLFLHGPGCRFHRQSEGYQYLNVLVLVHNSDINCVCPALQPVYKTKGNR